MNPRIAAASIVVAGATLVAASPFLMGFLEKWESGSRRVLTVYPDKLAGNLPTVCNGLTRHVTSTPIIVGQRWTSEQCAHEERAAIITLQHELARCFRVAPPQSVFDIGTEHGWNFGVNSTCNSLAMEAWNRGDWALGCRRLARSDAGKPVWSYVCTGTGRERTCTFVQGLANRREDAAAKCIPVDFSNVIGGSTWTMTT